MNPSRATQNPSFRHLHRQGGPKPRQSAEGIVALGDAVDVELPRKGRTRIPTLMLKDVDNMIIIYIYYNMNCRRNSLEDALVDLRECASHRMFKEQLGKNYAYNICLYYMCACLFIFIFII